MIRSLLLATAAFAALATVTVQAQAAVEVSSKARGMSQAAVAKRSAAHLNHKINHWAHKNGLKAVRVGAVSTTCGKSKAGLLTVCTSSAKVAR